MSSRSRRGKLIPLTKIDKQKRAERNRRRDRDADLRYKRWASKTIKGDK